VNFGDGRLADLLFTQERFAFMGGAGRNMRGLAIAVSRMLQTSLSGFDQHMGQLGK